MLLKRGTENGTEWNGNRNETENEMKVSNENEHMNFVDTIAYKGNDLK